MMMKAFKRRTELKANPPIRNHQPQQTAGGDESYESVDFGE